MHRLRGLVLVLVLVLMLVLGRRAESFSLLRAACCEPIAVGRGSLAQTQGGEAE